MAKLSSYPDPAHLFPVAVCFSILQVTETVWILTTNEGGAILHSVYVTKVCLHNLALGGSGSPGKIFYLRPPEIDSGVFLRHDPGLNSGTDHKLNLTYSAFRSSHRHK